MTGRCWKFVPSSLSEYKNHDRITLVDNGDFEDSAVLGVFIAVRTGGHEHVISCCEE